ncbi:MAG: hypothetical protein H0X51_07090 [Parachlamydiaceae bacterium]|nr:hypothetical protein [Parachlamydiaceae bacterium]
MTSKVIIFIVLSLSVALHPSLTALQDATYKTDKKKKTMQEKHPYMSNVEQTKIKPYLLPTKHPIYNTLQSIFTVQRATLNSETLASAGFNNRFTQPRSFIRVVSHPATPGYLFKLYLDSETRIKKNTPGWQWLVNRAKNATIIQSIITRKKIKHFVVAKKWIYQLPTYPLPPLNDPNYTPKGEILVVEDMNLVSKEENAHAWKTVITKEHLDEFYKIISSAGGSSYRIDNVAYTKSGKFAFIDTEYTNRTVDRVSITKYLSPKMANYWTKRTLFP